jgi:ATP-dependent RNA helicase DDX31/DBP7
MSEVMFPIVILFYFCFKVDWILQYNAPTTNADYVHRVGRTARIGAKGSSLLFVLPSEAEFIRDLESHNLLLAELTIEHVLQKLFRNSGWMAKRPHTMEEAATNLQVRLGQARLS